MRAWFIPAWTLAALLAGALSAHAQIAPREPPLQGPKGARDCIEMVAPAAPEDDPKIKAGRPYTGEGVERPVGLKTPTVRVGSTSQAAKNGTIRIDQAL